MRLTALLCILLFGCLPICKAQEPGGFRFKKADEKSFTLSFEYSQNLILIPVRINDSPPMRFVLDTGISNTIITELTGVDTLQLNYARQVKVAGLGTGNSAEAYYSAGNRLIIDHPDSRDAGIEDDHTDIFVLTTDHFELSKQLGIQVNGLIGCDLFDKFIVEIDPVEKKITFHNRDYFNPERYKKRFTPVPVEYVSGKPYANVFITQEDGSQLNTRLLIDTGASLSMWIAPRADPEIILPSRTVRALLGQGLSGQITGVNGRVQQVQIGPYSFRKPLVAYPDSASIEGIALGKQRHGSLGNDILRRFTFIADFPKGILYLKPNKWYYNPFTYNRSGMEVEKPYPEIPVFTIFSVIPGSPADRAGLFPGDVIEYINFMPAFNLTLDDINHILHGEEGKTVNIRINRNGIMKRIRFQLEGKI